MKDDEVLSVSVGESLQIIAISCVSTLAIVGIVYFLSAVIG